METNVKIQCRSPRIGDVAPDFHARSTAGDFQLSKLRGRWVVFFSHPADFTPVCSTEFAELARRQSEFDSLETSLVGLSVDSLYSHFAWIRAIQATLGAEVRFPVIEDPTMAIGRAYGMVDETSADSMAMRSTFFIDPEGIIRAITCYPHNVGRSVDEMLRLVSALKTVATIENLAPEGWRAGAPLLQPPCEMPDDCPDWFCRFVDAA